MHQKDQIGGPLVLVDRGKVVMCCARASRHMIAAGMKLSEAQAACADLQWRQWDEALYEQAQKELCRQLIGCSPRVSALEPGVFLLDANGLAYMGGEQKFCFNVHKIVGRAGYADQRVGIADSAFAASVASKIKRRQHFIVNKGEDQQFLSPLSIKHLPISEDMQESLHELGIRTIGQLSSLSIDSMAERFGNEGVRALELACGIDRRQPSLPMPEKEFAAFVDLGAPIELLHEIQFVLKSMIDQLSKRLSAEGLWAEELHLSFFNDNENFDSRPIKLLRPSNNTKFLLEVMKLSLESRPLSREVTAIALRVSQFTNEAWEQLETDKTEEESTQKDVHSLSLSLMLQRFITRLGEDTVVRSVPNDQHIPEHAGAWLSVTGKQAAGPVVPVNVAYLNSHVPAGGLISGLALRKLPAPHPVLIEFNGEQPAALTFQGKWYKIKEITEPERLSGLWWESSVRRSYYIAFIHPRESTTRTATEQTAAGLLVMLVHDHEQNGWFINGIYD